MNPDQNQYSVDYLNQIAPTTKKPIFSSKLFIAGLAGVVLLVIVIIILLNVASAGPSQKMQTLAARLLTMQTLSSDAQKTIKSGALRSINSNLTIYLTNTNRDIVAPLKSNGIDATKIDASITLQEDGSDVRKRLEDARLNALYDRTYVREVNYQLDTVTTLMKELYDTSDSTSLKEFLIAADNDLQPIKKQFSEFKAD